METELLGLGEHLHPACLGTVGRSVLLWLQSGEGSEVDDAC